MCEELFELRSSRAGLPFWISLDQLNTVIRYGASPATAVCKGANDSFHVKPERKSLHAKFLSVLLNSPKIL